MTTAMLKFEQDGTLPGGEKSYRLVIDGKTISEGLSLDQVIEAINRRDAGPDLPPPGADEGSQGRPQPRRVRDEAHKARPANGNRGKESEKLGEEHGTRPSQADPRRPLSVGCADSSPRRGEPRDGAPAERRRKAALGPSRR